MTNVIVRGFAGHALLVEEPGSIDEAVAAEQMLRMILMGCDWIELEFPDAPPAERFFRFGANPAGMVMPQIIKLRGPDVD